MSASWSAYFIAIFLSLIVCRRTFPPTSLFRHPICGITAENLAAGVEMKSGVNWLGGLSGVPERGTRRNPLLTTFFSLQCISACSMQYGKEAKGPWRVPGYTKVLYTYSSARKEVWEKKKSSHT